MITELEREQVSLDTLTTLVNDIYRQEKDFITASEVIDFIELNKKVYMQVVDTGIAIDNKKVNKNG